MGEAADKSSEKSHAEQDEKLVLEYSSLSRIEGGSPTFSSIQVVWPFGLGAMLPFIVTSFQLGLEEISFGCFVAWGLSAMLLLGIKLRGLFVQLRPNGRPWWVCMIGGVVNITALYFIVGQTTARQEFWPILGAGGSFAIAVMLDAVIALAIAMVLTPGDRKERSA